MKIGLRGGHSPNCKGAIGLMDEQAEVRKIYDELALMLKSAGHIVVDCNSDASTAAGELSEGTNKANTAKCDIYITLHMNAAGSAAEGTEVWLYDASNQQTSKIATAICSNFASKDFANRGVKYSTGYHDLNASAMPAMIVEVLFCTNVNDVMRYKKLGAKGTAELIARAIDGKATAKEQESYAGGMDMQCMFTIDGKETVYWLHDGKIVELRHADEMKIVKEIYKANCGHDIPNYKWSSKAPWYARLMAALNREPVVSIK